MSFVLGLECKRVQDPVPGGARVPDPVSPRSCERIGWRER